MSTNRLRQAVWAAGALSLWSLQALGNPVTPDDWRQANHRVGELLRGHTDVVRWERQHPMPMVQAPAARSPALTLDDALRAARQTRPDLVAEPGTGAQDRARLQRDTAAWAWQVQQAWLDAVATRAALHHLAPVVNATQAATELARRMVAVGNWSAARGAEAELGWLAVQNQWTLAQQRARHAERRLRQHLPSQPDGTQAPVTAELPHTLAPLPAVDAPAPADATAQALARHPDWPLTHAEAERRAAALGAVHQVQLNAALARWQDAAGPTGLAQRPLGTPWPHGWSEAAEARANADALARQVQTDVALALDDQATTRLLLDRAEQALALTQQQLDDVQQRYNGMLSSTWDLLAAGRARAQAAQALTDARHAAWRAEYALQAVLAGLTYPDNASSADTGAASPAAPKGH